MEHRGVSRAREAIILAGGFGTRLRDLFPDTPKPLVPVRGVPFLHYILHWLERQGIQRVIVCTGHLAAKVEAELARFGGRLELTSLREESPLGTGGAIYRALGKVRGERAFALNGDTYFPADLAAIEAAARRLGTDLAVALRHVDDTSRYGAVTVEAGRIRAVNEKARGGPGLINAGLYLLPATLPARVPMPAIFSWETDLLQPKAVELGFAGVAADVPFLDIGTPESYSLAESVLPVLPVPQR